MLNFIILLLYVKAALAEKTLSPQIILVFITITCLRMLYLIEESVNVK